MTAAPARTLLKSPRPIAYQLELTNHCPYTCVGCPRTDHMHRPLGMMSAETFRAVVDAVAPWQREHWPMALHHMGEALLHPEIASHVRYASGRGVPTALACRPNHLTPERAEAILAAGLCLVVVTVDALDTPTMRALTGKVADFEKAEANVRALIEIKRRLGSPARVLIQMIAYAENRHQWSAFLERFASSDPSVLALLKRYSSWTVPELARFGAASEKFLGGSCRRPFNSFVVLWDGSVVPCCRDHDGAVVLGNIHEGLDQIWNGSRYEAFRAAFDGDALPRDHMCRGCSLYPWAPKSSAAADAWVEHDDPIAPYSGEWWIDSFGHLVDRDVAR
jgi:radical SAM protein with 4Fe4S-binding SPASM domain